MLPAIRYFVSPRIDATRLWIILPPAMLVAVLIGVAYSAFQTRVNDLYYRIGGLAAMAVALSLLTGGVLYFVRAQRPAWVVAIGTLLGLVALWASWVMWVHFVLAAMGLDVSVVRLALNPAGLLRVIAHINDMGVWNYEHRTYRGTTLLIVWIIEALAIVVGSTAAASFMLKPRLFCRACRKECKPVPKLPRFDADDTSKVRERVEAGDFDYLLQLGPVRREDDPYLQLRLFCCSCGLTNVLNVDRVSWQDNNKGGLDITRKALVEPLLLDAVQVGEVKALGDRLAEMNDSEPKDSDDENDDGDNDASSSGNATESDDDPYARR